MSDAATLSNIGTPEPVTPVPDQDLPSNTHNPVPPADPQTIKKVEDFLNTAKEGVLAIDEEGMISYVNSTLSRIIGQPADRLLGCNYTEIAPDTTSTLKSLEDAHMQTLKFLADSETKRKEMTKNLKHIQEEFLKFIINFVKVSESRDLYMQGHSARVARLAMILAKGAGLDRNQIQNLAYSGMFHDLGMITISLDIMHKATKLAPSEYLEIRKHPEMGAVYLKGIDIFADVIPAVLHHHEWWDGRGYPKGLKGEDIPLPARILHIAEAFDAITSRRPFRLARSRDEAIKILTDSKKTQFDPRLIDIFIRLLDSGQV